MELRFSKSIAVAAAGALLATTLIYACLTGYHTIRRIVAPESRARPPLQLSAHPIRIRSVSEEAKVAGLKVDDGLVAVNGRPAKGLGVYFEALASTPPGGEMRFTIQAGSGVRDAIVTLRPAQRSVHPFFEFFIEIAVPSFCFALGYVIVFLRPMDLRAWILLGLMINFGVTFTSPSQGDWPEFLRPLATAYRVSASIMWPAFLLMLGMRFPDRLPVRPWIHKMAIALCVPLLLFTCFAIGLELVLMNDASRAGSALAFARSAQTPALLYTLFVISCFFAAIARAYRLAQSPDARRKARLLNIGTYASFLPALFLILYGLTQGKIAFTEPTPIVIFCVIMLAVFPLTLAYLVIVHRALDVRVVLRMGLQYALASRGILVLQILIGGGAVLYATQTTNATHSNRRAILAGTAVLMLLTIPAARRARVWADRRFFREAYAAEKILSDLSEEVHSIADTRSLLETVSRRISESLHVPQIAAMLRQGQAFTPAYALGFAQDPAAVFPENDPVLERLSRERTPQTTYLDDPNSWIHRELNHAESRQRLADLQSQLLLPLSSRHGLIGFMSLGAKRSEEPYSPSDLRLLRSVAAQAGLAIENSRLAAEMAHELAHREQFHKEMSIARDVQQRLFPHKRPPVPGIEYDGLCRPAQSVGGDYFDFVELPNGEFGVAIGDVSGKGMPAALLMAALQASVRGQAMNGINDLPVFLSNVNRLIYDMSPRSHFATLFYAQYNPTTRVLRYANAGHNPPLLLRKGAAQWLRATGPGTGLSRRASYQAVEIALEADDLLVAYTDGFTEAMNPDREEYGDQRLLLTLSSAAGEPVSELMSALIANVDQFSAGAPQHDDMTIIALRVRAA
ncbi:MAG: SpoIIE family protein phosphatase [Bryobacterales bacterium]|nr:SpoIIE family protein phosphatase [Bryobacterales bacterium]